PLYNSQVTDAGATSGPTYQSGDVANTGVLDAGETWTYTATYQITQADLNSGEYTNIASAKGSADLNGDGINETEVVSEDTVTVNGSRTPAVEILLSASVTEFNAVGDAIVYTVIVTNTGNVDLTNVLITDNLSGYEEAIANLIPSEQQTLTFN